MRRYERIGLGALALLAILAAPARLSAAEGESITMSVNAMRNIEVPFPITEFRVASDAVAKAEQIGPQTLRVLALEAGTTDLDVRGAASARTYNISVIESIVMMLQSMKRALDTVPEVELSESVGRVMLTGEISNIAHWNHVKKVVAAYGSGLMIDLTSLTLPPELLLQLSDGLKLAGFEVSTEGAAAPNVLQVKGGGRLINISGQVYSRRDIDKINAVVGSQQWLVIKGGGTAAPAQAGGEGESDAGGAAEPESGGEASDESFYVTVNVAVVPTLLETDVAFISLNDEDHRKIGVNLWEAGLMTIDAAGALTGDAMKMWSSDRQKNQGLAESQIRTYTDTTSVGPNLTGVEWNTRERNIARGENTGYNNSYTYSVATKLSGVLDFFIENKPDRLIQKGHFTFQNEADDWKEFHSGGTLNVRVVSDNTADLEEIDYGLIMKVKGGLASAKDADLDVDLELSSPERIEGTGDIDVKKDRIATRVTCPLGHTLVMSGANKLLDSAGNSGVPVLRSIPLLKYLFNAHESERMEKRLLILMGPQVVGAPTPSRPLSEETIKYLDDVTVPAKERERHGKRPYFYF